MGASIFCVNLHHFIFCLGVWGLNLAYILYPQVVVGDHDTTQEDGEQKIAPKYDQNSLGAPKL